MRSPQPFTFLARAPLALTSLALCCATLAACAPFGWHAVAPPAALSDDAYQAGRVHHLAQRHAAAQAAYAAVLRDDPAHAGARNGLATLHAERGELAQAIAIWRTLTASLTRTAGPGQAYLFGNLGQAHLRNGEPEAARTAFEKACLLDPLDPRAWQLLGQSLAALGQDERARQMFAQAEALRRHDLRADFAATGATTEVAAIGKALQAPARHEDPDRAPDLTLDSAPDLATDFDKEWVEVGADGMMALRRAPARREAPLPVPGDTPPYILSDAPAMARLEIRNGNGVPGMARALSRRIDEPGLRVARLSNAPGFAVARTRVDHTAAHAEAARRLARRLDHLGQPGHVELRQVNDCAPADLRLVLGRDLARHGTALRLAPATSTGGQEVLLSYR